MSRDDVSSESTSVDDEKAQEIFVRRTTDQKVDGVGTDATEVALPREPEVAPAGEEEELAVEAIPLARESFLLIWARRSRASPMIATLSLVILCLLLSAIMSMFHISGLRFQADVYAREFSLITGDTNTLLRDFEANGVTIREIPTLNTEKEAPQLGETLTDTPNSVRSFKSHDGMALGVESIIIPAHSEIVLQAYERSDKLEISIRPAVSSPAPKDIVVRVIWDSVLEATRHTGALDKNGPVPQLATFAAPSLTLILHKPSVEWNFAIPFKFKSIDFTRIVRSDAEFVSEYRESQIKGGTLRFFFLGNAIDPIELPQGQFVEYINPIAQVTRLSYKPRELFIQMEGDVDDVRPGMMEGRYSIYPSALTAAQSWPLLRVMLSVALGVLLALVGVFGSRPDVSEDASNPKVS